MLEVGTISQALTLLCRASDSDLLEFVSQIKPVVDRLQTLSCTWSKTLQYLPGVNNESSRPVSPSQALKAHAPRSTTDTSSNVTQADVTQASGQTGAEARLASDHIRSTTKSNNAADDELQQAKGRARIKQFFTGVGNCLDDIRTYLHQEERIAVGQPSWKSEHPLVVDVQINSNESTASHQVLFRRALSQLELAKRYQLWEWANHKSSKVQQLVENLSAKGTGHIGPYLQAQEDYQDKEAASKGIRHGIKHLVICELLKRSLTDSGELNDCEDVNGFSAIMAFVYTRCRNVRYIDVPILIGELSSPQFNHICKLAKERSLWFRRCQTVHADNITSMHPTASRKRMRMSDELHPWVSASNSRLIDGNHIPQSEEMTTHNGVTSQSGIVQALSTEAPNSDTFSEGESFTAMSNILEPDYQRSSITEGVSPIELCPQIPLREVVQNTDNWLNLHNPFYTDTDDWLNLHNPFYTEDPFELDNPFEMAWLK